MKLFKNLLLILTLTLTITSCSKDDETHVPTNSEKIIGAWELTDYTNVKTVTTILGAETTSVTTTSTGKLFDGTEIEYKESPKNMTSTGDFVMIIKSKIDDKPEITEEKKVVLDEIFGSGTWVIENDNILTIKRDNKDYLFKISQLTNTTLKIDTDSEVTFSSGASETKTTIVTNIVFSKK